VAAFRDILHLNVDRVDARERFLARLAGVDRSREKRIRIGHEFIAIFEEEAKKARASSYLVQGTLYPDVIESKTPDSKPGHKIKSHHNVGGLPERWRSNSSNRCACSSRTKCAKSGACLGLPEQIVQRQPFPGPGWPCACSAK
jgi:GMP synthase (glutamine-hydrolysing)